MRNYESKGWNVTAFDNAVYLQEKMIVSVTDSQMNGGIVKLYKQPSKESQYLLASYHTDEHFSVDIDLTDYIRAFRSLGQITIVADDDATFNITWSVAGLINPSSLIIPRQTKYDEPWTIFFPAMMLKDCGFGNIVELQGVGSGAGWEAGSYGSGDLHNGSNEFPVGLTIFEFGDVNAHTCVLKPLECGVRYATVEWTSCTGSIKRHTWIVKGVTSEVDETINLQTLDGVSRQIKGRRDGFTIALGGLNAYDIWYYSDIIFSSNVRISLDGQTWRNVSVEGKSVTLPDGDFGEFSKLEINVNYRRYDAFGL